MHKHQIKQQIVTNTCTLIASIAVLLLVKSSPSNAQIDSRPRENNQKPDSTWWSKSTYPYDSLAAAAILFDYGICVADPHYGTKFTHHRRIKIYNKQGINEWGNLEIFNENMKLVHFSGTVYNLTDGEIVKSSISLSNVTNERYSKNINRHTVAFTGVKEGSVIEYSYVLKSPYYLIRDWSYQYSIPVLWSEYELFFPGNMAGIGIFVHGLKDFYDIDVKEKGKRRRYIMTRIPSFKEEPFMPNPKFYKSYIEFDVTKSRNDFQIVYTKDRLMQFGIIRDSLLMDSKTSAEATIYINTDGIISGTTTLSIEGLGASLMRKTIMQSGEDEFFKDYLSTKSITVNSKEIRNGSVLKGKEHSPLILSYSFTTSNNATVSDSLIYINPYLVINEEENPFKADTRIYPVDMGARIDRTLRAELFLPESYTVDEIPQSGIIELPNRAGSFVLNMTRLGNKIMLTSRLKMNKIIFNVNEYAIIREFFTRIISKQSEPIILKKVK